MDKLAATCVQQHWGINKQITSRHISGLICGFQHVKAAVIHMLEKLATKWAVFYESLDRLTNPSNLYYQRTVFDDEVIAYLKNNSGTLRCCPTTISRTQRITGRATDEAGMWGSRTAAKLGKSDVKATTIASAPHAACVFTL